MVGGADCTAYLAMTPYHKSWPKPDFTAKLSHFRTLVAPPLSEPHNRKLKRHLGLSIKANAKLIGPEPSNHDSLVFKVSQHPPSASAGRTSNCVSRAALG